MLLNNVKSKDASPIAFNFPISDALLKEDPTLIANQPKGTLHLSVACIFSVPTQKDKMVVSPDESRVKYSLIFECVRIFREQKTYYGKLLGKENERGKEGDKASITGMEMIFGDSGGLQKKVVIHGRQGDIEFHSDANGVCVIPFDEALFQEDPWVSLPTNIVPEKVELRPRGALVA